MKEQQKQHESGFTLIETLIATFLLAVGALALAQLMTMGIYANARSKDETQIAVIAQQKLEQLYQQGYSNLAVGGSLTTAVTDFHDLDQSFETATSTTTYHQNQAKYDIYWQVTEGGTEIADCPWKEISVRVVSNKLKFGAEQREVTLRTQILRPF